MKNKGLFLMLVGFALAFDGFLVVQEHPWLTVSLVWVGIYLVLKGYWEY